jgi:hypothetical protein
MRKLPCYNKNSRCFAQASQLLLLLLLLLAAASCCVNGRLSKS